MPSVSRAVTIPRPPADVFPWLLEADRVPKWTSGLERYEPAGPIAAGGRIRQRLSVSGQTIDVDMEISRYDPPHGAETRFTISGLAVVNVYALAPADGGTRLTQSLEAKASGLTARLLVPVVQPRLERKVGEDLERLRELLA